MTQTVEAVWDGKVIRLLEPLVIAPNTTVRVTVETIDTVPHTPPLDFGDICLAANLDGPEDWSENLELTSDIHFVQAGYEALLRRDIK
jgi:hypothetical protein